MYTQTVLIVWVSIKYSISAPPPHSNESMTVSVLVPRRYYRQLEPLSNACTSTSQCTCMTYKESNYLSTWESRSGINVAHSIDQIDLSKTSRNDLRNEIDARKRGYLCSVQPQRRDSERSDKNEKINRLESGDWILRRYRNARCNSNE